MNLIKQSVKLLSVSDEFPLQVIEEAARTCYQSESKNNTNEFVKMLMRRGHLSPLEHVTARVELITDRGVSHQIVRHRLTSVNQESTRYVRYKTMEFILPVEFYEVYDLTLKFRNSCIYVPGMDSEICQIFTAWKDSIASAGHAYKQLLKMGCAPQLARSVLPNSLKTTLIVTCNLREWLHILNVRCDKSAHPQIRSLMLDVLRQLHARIPVVFDLLKEEYDV